MIYLPVWLLQKIEKIKIKIKIIKIIKIKALPGICKSAVQASFNKMVFVSCPSLFIICNEGR